MEMRTAQGDLANYDFSSAVRYHHGGFPPTQLDLAQMIGPLGGAREALARYDQMLTTLRNGALLLAPMRRQEAVVSSRIEGTITTLDALLQYEAEGEEHRSTNSPAQSDTVETYLYARAMREAEAKIYEGWPISRPLIRETHQTLLSSGRGRNRNPGEFKTEQNYIADKLRKRVHFVPIEPAHLEPGLDALFFYSLSTTVPDPLIKIAVFHAEFEALHPFDDGNGRIGRMLVTLMLWQASLLNGPHFFLSAHFEREKDEYIERLRAVSARGDWSGWCVFFFEAITIAARESLATAEKISGLYDDMREAFRDATNSQWHGNVLDYMFESPVFYNNRFTSHMVEACGISTATAARFTRELAEKGFLKVVRPGTGRAPTIFAFEPLISILRV